MFLTRSVILAIDFLGFQKPLRVGFVLRFSHVGTVFMTS